MNSIVWTNIFRGVALLLFQVLVLQGLNISGFASVEYIQFIIYPLFILLLPHDTPIWTVLLLSFGMGITVDVFYNSMGVHASASVLTGGCRHLILKLQEPKGGYIAGQSPTRFRLGTPAYLRYTLTAMTIHIFWYHTMEFFTLAYIGKIILRTVITLPISMLLVMTHAYLFNPKN